MYHHCELEFELLGLGMLNALKNIVEDTTNSLRNGFWLKIRIDSSNIDMYLDSGIICKEYMMNKPFVGQVRGQPTASF